MFFRTPLRVAGRRRAPHTVSGLINADDTLIRQGRRGNCSSLAASSKLSSPSSGCTVRSTPPSTAPKKKTNLLSFTQKELAAELKATHGLPAFRAQQVWRWLYRKGESDISAFSDLSASDRAALASTHCVDYGHVRQFDRASDGTLKWLVGEHEAVYIPPTPGDLAASQIGGGAVCVSSQVACSLSCAFCHTGSMPKSMLRNLESEEIVGQVLLAKHALGDFTRAKQEKHGVTNIVMMGMGEPLYNYRRVKRALNTLMDPDGLAFSKRRITLSTSGVVPAIDRLGKELNVSLAISLHAVTDELRDVLVPLNKTFPLRELLAACRRYPGTKPSRKLTFEYIMLDGVNDSDADARELIRLLHGIPSLVNLIPFNPWPGSEYRPSSNNRVRSFAEMLNGRADPNLVCSVRWPRGRDIMAACGQLAASKPPLTPQ